MGCRASKEINAYELMVFVDYNCNRLDYEKVKEYINKDTGQLVYSEQGLYGIYIELPPFEFLHKKIGISNEDYKTMKKRRSMIPKYLFQMNGIWNFKIHPKVLWNGNKMKLICIGIGEITLFQITQGQGIAIASNGEYFEGEMIESPDRFYGRLQLQNNCYYIGEVRISNIMNVIF